MNTTIFKSYYKKIKQIQYFKVKNNIVNVIKKLASDKHLEKYYNFNTL